MTSQKLVSKIIKGGRYCVYLRKSRSDMEAEARGEEETLARHERNLLDLADSLNIHIPPEAIFREVVSGETIENRPVMQKVLLQVEEGKWDGVLVVEVERLARGDTGDQAVVAETFKYSGTTIVTPNKIYDPNDEFDEEYFEFGLFMSRREYKTINRRLQRGRRDSIREGKFVGSVPPFGYVRKKLKKEKGYILELHPEQAPIVEMVFDMYVNQRIGSSNIANRLNELMVPTAKGAEWDTARINKMIENPSYYGLVYFGKRPVKKIRSRGVTTKKTRPVAPEEEWTTGKGRHEPIVSYEMWLKAQELMEGNNLRPPVPSGIVTCTLAGLVKCGVCGRAMVRRPYRKNFDPSFMCSRKGCACVSSLYDLVEDRVLQGLGKWIVEYKAKWESGGSDIDRTSIIEAKKIVMKKIEKELNKLKQQSSNLDDLLEQGLYSPEKYRERSQALTQRIEDAKRSLQAAEEEVILEEEQQRAKIEIIPQVEHVLDVYPKTEDAMLKNELLRSVIETCIYTKTIRGHWTHPETLEQFELKIYPKLPKREY